MIWVINSVLLVLCIVLIVAIVRDKDDAPAFPQAGPRHALRPLPSWYQLASEAQRTDRMIERAALLLAGP